jgi:hypothetical protein
MSEGLARAGAGAVYIADPATADVVPRALVPMELRDEGAA